MKSIPTCGLKSKEPADMLLTETDNELTRDLSEMVSGSLTE